MKRKIGTKIEDIRFQATAIKFFKRKREYVHVEGPVSQVSKQLYRGIEKKRITLRSKFIFTNGKGFSSI